MKRRLRVKTMSRLRMEDEEKLMREKKKFEQNTKVRSFEIMRFWRS